MPMASLSLGSARIIKFKIIKIKPESQVYAIVLPSLFHPYTQPEYNTSRKKKHKEIKDEL